MDDFSGQIAVVTGATRGIGRAISEAFLNQGARVVGIYQHNELAAREFLESKDWDDRLTLHRCDVSKPEVVAELFSEIESTFDTIDILVNNAGIRRDGVVAMMTNDDWQEVIDVNLTGSFLMARHALLLMLKQKYGRIIMITSPMAYLGFPGQANYSASKAGQIGMVRSLAREAAKRKITVNCISPGFIETELLADLSDDQLKAYKKMVPMNRFGRPEEVADAVLFLASNRASYITGTVLDVHGGL
ncbi:MAG: 3-oxoacyl-ACP reductase FabG [Proteobacteria bacterium]|nr:3-oxoacyl-ACP reductase FabG [Pseudomonadota bacterium]MBU1686554.1 3-oxoacyl-ACP reductase FabG [Pseudomonadota bacterium]